MRELEEGFDPYDETAGFFSSVGKAFSGAAKGVAKATTSVVKTTAKGVSGAAKGVSSATKTVGNTFGKVPIVGKGLKGLVNLTVAPYQASINLLSGQRIDRAVVNSMKSQLQAYRDVAPYVQTVISFVPGVGPGISGAIAAAVTLSEGKPITEALISATKNALPGGPLAAAAFDVAVAAARGQHISDIALAAVPLPASQKDLLKQSLQVAKDVAAGKKISKIVLDRVNANLSKLPSSVAKAAQIGIALGQGQNIQKTLIKAAPSMMNFKNPIAAANTLMRTAEGATKAGVTKAVGAAQAIKNGSPILNNALQKAGSQFRPGSVERMGFNTAVNVLKRTSGNTQALGAARRALPTEAARRAFDNAIGAVSHTVSNNKSLATRAGSIFNPQMSRVKGTISPYQPNLKHAIDTLRKDPTLAAQHPMVLANKFGTTQQTILGALKHVGTQRLLPWRSLSPAAASMVQKWNRFAPISALTHGTNDTAGLDETGTKYVVEKGDSPFKIAQKLTGNGNRWVELKALNKDKKPDITKNVWVGEVLNLPASWQKPIARPQASSGPAVSSQPSPQAPSGSVSLPPAISVAPGTLQAKAILVAWGKTDGIKEAGVTDYGSTAADLSTDFGARDKLQLRSFQNWANKPGNPVPNLVVDGILGPKSLAALQFWAENRAKQTDSTPVGPIVTTLPGVLITAAPPVASPGLPTVSPPISLPPAPVSLPPVIAVQTPAQPAPPVPTVAPPSQPATPATVAAAGQAAGSSSKMGPALAGAAIGGTLFGLPGAIIGGIAGAAMS